MTTYTFSTIDDPFGGSVASGINDLGQIVGSYTDSGGVTHGFLYSGDYTTLDDDNPVDPADTIVSTSAYGINDQGFIVGNFAESNNTVHGFLYNGGYLYFNPGSSSGLFGVSDVEFVGQYTDNNISHAFDAALLSVSNPILLSDPFGFNGTFVQGINDLGQSVGYYVDSNHVAHGFLYSGGSSGTYTTIDDPLGTRGTFAYGINDRGQIVGAYTDSHNIPHGFLYSGGTYTTIDDPLGALGNTIASGINNAGQIVGRYTGQDGFTHGFLATAPTAPTSVQQEILGLYATLYDRAADFPGYQYWVGIDGQQPDSGGVTVANAASTAVTVHDAQLLGHFFVDVQSTFFNVLYGGLNDGQFINAMYKNIGGSTGDPGGVAFWTGLLQQAENAGQSIQDARAGLIGQFVDVLVSFDSTNRPPGLTDAQWQDALTRQAAINDRIVVSAHYSDASQRSGGTILDAQNVGDAAYNAAITVLHGVTADPTTVNVAITGISKAVGQQDLTLI